MRFLLLLSLLFISHTTSCISGHVSLGHQAISYSLRCLTGQGRGDKDLFVLHWFFYNEFEDVQAPTQVQWHDAELTVKWHLQSNQAKRSRR